MTRTTVLAAAVLATLVSSAAAQTWLYPIDVTPGPDGSILVADRTLPGIWELKDGQSTVLVQASKKFRTPLNAIRCLYTAPDGAVFAGDTATREVYALSADGKLKQLTATTPALVDAPLTEDLAFTPDNFGLVEMPMAIVSNSAGELFVSDTDLQRVWKIPAGGGTPVEVLAVSGPRGLAVDKEDHLWVLSLNQPQLQRVAPDGTATAIVEGTPFDMPHQVELGPDGAAYISDGYAKTIWKIPPGGQPEKWITGDPLVNPVGISFQGDNLLIVDPRANALFSAAPDGTLTKVFPAE